MTGEDNLVPESLRGQVHDRLDKSGALERIDHRIKVAMCAAIEVLRGDKSSRPIFENIGFKKPEPEIQALQTVYAYLKSVGLTWTLETIVQETNVQVSEDAETLSLIDLLEQGNGEGEGDELEAEEEEDDVE
jgi:hypothetical protein